MKIGFIGLGVMGSGMCANIIRKHSDQVFVYDVDAVKIQQMESLGAVGVKSSLEAAERSEIIFTMVPRSEHSKAVWQEALPAMGPGKIGVDMSTIDPSVSLEIAGMIKETGAEFADCPVVKSKSAAEAGTLGIYAGCTEEIYKILEPMLYYMGAQVLHMGENGRGICMKICQNALSHEIQAAVNETMTLAGLNGIGVEEFAKAVSMGGARNSYLESKYEAIRDRNYQVAFPVKYALKDLNICRRLSEESGFDMPVLNLAINFLNEAVDMGLEDADNCACIEAVRKGTPLGLSSI